MKPLYIEQYIEITHATQNKEKLQPPPIHDPFLRIDLPHRRNQRWRNRSGIAPLIGSSGLLIGANNATAMQAQSGNGSACAPESWILAYLNRLPATGKCG